MQLFPGNEAYMTQKQPNIPRMNAKYEHGFDQSGKCTNWSHLPPEYEILARRRPGYRSSRFKIGAGNWFFDGKFKSSTTQQTAIAPRQ
jgi:hypothetical protein